MELNDDDKQKIRDSLPKIHNLVARNLIKAITEGKIPTDRQLEMLKSAVAMPENDSPAPASADFKLDAVIVPEGHQEAADFWGVSRKTLTRWKEAGKKAEDPCPYRTAPEQMADWYKRVFAKPVPDAIPKTLERIRPAPAAAPSAPAPATGGQLPPLDMSQFKPEDYNFNVMQMGMATIWLAQRKLLEAALATGDGRQVNQALEKFQETTEALRKLESTGGKIQEQQGLTYRASDVRAAIVEAHQFIPVRLKAELKRMVRLLPGLTMSEREMDDWADQTADSACATLVKTDLSITKTAA